MSVLKKHGDIAVGVIILICVILFTACSSGERGTLLDYQKNITGASVKWELDGMKYEGEISFDGEIPTDPTQYRAATVTLTSPEEIAGLTVKYSADSAEASVGNVSFVLPENTGEELYRLVRSFSLYSDEMKGAGNGSGTDAAVRFEVDTCGNVTEYDITYNDAKHPQSAVIIWGNDEKMTVDYREIRVGE